MEIKLTALTLENFKGLRKFTLEPGDHCLIKGANATGKTTLPDAFDWLLFDKDSQGKADFAIKTLKDGQAIPNIEHSVEGLFDINGQARTLKKVLKEKYTKKRGASRADFTGHTTDHYIDSVPVQEKEWNQQISDIIDEETFKLLTSPTYFNSDKFGQNKKPVRPAWERRRELLFSLPDDVPSDAEIIFTIPGLEEVLNGKTPDAHRKIVKETQTEINKRLTEIPSRIDELDKSLADVSTYDIDAINKEIKGLDDEIQAMNDDTVRSNLRKQKAELEAKISELEADKERAGRAVIKEVEGKIEALQKELSAKQYNIENALADIGRKEDAVNYNMKEMVLLRSEYVKIADNKVDLKDTCPTCGQALPKDQVQDAIKRHNQEQASRLTKINSEGKQLKKANEELGRGIEYLTEQGVANEKTVKDLNAKIDDLKKTPINVSFDTSAIDKIKGELQEINKKLVDNLPPDTGPLEERRKTLQAQIAEIDAAKRIRARIEELKTEEKKLAAEYEELEHQISLMEQFTVAKVEMLEEKINNRFELARFKLFEKQINEGIKDTCITLYDGVPYGYGLNTGAEINVGLDIVRTLSMHYGIKAPIFIDHAESVTDILDPGTQTIKLMVSEDHPKMEVTNHG